MCVFVLQTSMMVSKVTIRSQLIAVSSIERSELYFYDDSAENSDEHYIGRLTIRKHELAGPIIVLRNVSQLTALTVTDETIQNGETKLSSWCNTDGLSYVMLLYRKRVSRKRSTTRICAFTR